MQCNDKILNENDEKLLAFCSNRPRHLSEIARGIGVDVKNVSVRISKLEELNLISVFKIGNKKFIKTNLVKKQKEYYLEVLKNLKRRGGILTQEEYMTLLPFSFEDEDYYDKFDAPLRLLYTQPKLVEHYIKITPEGEHFLKEHSKK